jgi:hypothetical protein
MLDNELQKATSPAAIERWAEDTFLSQLSFVHAYCSDSTGTHLQGSVRSHQSWADIEVWWRDDGIVAVRVEARSGLSKVLRSRPIPISTVPALMRAESLRVRSCSCNSS